MGDKYIYVICEAEGATAVKIGFSANPDKRVLQLQAGHATPLVVYHRERVASDKVRGMEKVIHRLLSHRKLTGEWFGLSPEEAALQVKHAMIRYGDEEDLSARIRYGRFIE